MKKVFYNFRLFDGVHNKLQDGKIIFTNGERIEKIDNQPEMFESSYESVNMKGLTLLPGLLDLHVHVTVPLMNEFRGLDNIRSVKKQRELNFRSCIKYGVTTIRDMGAFPDSIQDWKQLINEGEAVGPRVYTPNSFITSKDGAPERYPNIPLPVRKIFGGNLAERVRTPQEVRKVALRNIRQQADFLKTQYAETSMFFQGKLVNLSDACFDELKRIADEYHLKIAMHQTDNAGFRKGIQFGFDCLEHCSLDVLDQRDIDQFVAQKMAIVPTLRVNHSGLELDETLNWIRGNGLEDYTPQSHRQIVESLQLCKSDPYPPDKKRAYLDVEKSRRGFETTLQNVERLKKAGAMIGVGTDAFGCYLNLPGFYWKELLFLSDAGLSNFEVLQSATRTNAKILGIEQEVGSIEPGKFADFVFIDGNPLEDLKHVKDIRLVVKNGDLYQEGRKIPAFV